MFKFDTVCNILIEMETNNRIKQVGIFLAIVYKRNYKHFTSTDMTYTQASFHEYLSQTCLAKHSSTNKYFKNSMTIISQFINRLTQSQRKVSTWYPIFLQYYREKDSSGENLSTTKKNEGITSLDGHNFFYHLALQQKTIKLVLLIA